MSRPDFTAPTAPTRASAATQSNMRPAQAATPALPVGFAASGGAASHATFRQVHAEVARFIAGGGSSGAPAGAGAGSALNAEGAALRARLTAAKAIGGSEAGASTDAAQQAFLDAIRPHAEAAAARLGVAPELVSAHAALESGWGRHAPSFNLFGIKAGGNWQGAVQALDTTEVENGNSVLRNERFRGYGDMGSAFSDYAGLLLDNPRYQRALNTGNDAQAFARALAAGGYATDPAYADKLRQVADSIARRN